MNVTIFSAMVGIEHVPIQDYTWVVIDVLRASTTILCLMENGIEQVKIVGSVEEALELKQQGYIPVGERGDEPLVGFEYDNSPYAVFLKDWRKKRVALTTTNGTRALVAVKDGHKVIVAGFRNLDAVAACLNKLGNPVAIIPIGDQGNSRIEDELCAQALYDRILGKTVDWDDIKAQVVEERKTKIQAKGWAYAQDIELALTPNTTSIIPFLAKDMTLEQI
jgi:2-phosphosulfolactate phosphatase